MRPKLEANISREVERATDRLSTIDFGEDAVYALWLAQTFHFVSHTGRLICSAAARFSLEDEAFHKMLVSHFGEEEDHQTLAKNDVLSLVSELPVELAITRVFHRHLRYQIEHESPYSIFGRIYLLEGLACEAGPEILARLSPKAKKTATTFLKLHAEEDQKHHAESLKLLAKMPESELKYVQESLETSAALYAALTQEIASFAASRSLRRAG